LDTAAPSLVACDCASFVRIEASAPSIISIERQAEIVFLQMEPTQTSLSKMRPADAVPEGVVRSLDVSVVPISRGGNVGKFRRPVEANMRTASIDNLRRVLGGKRSSPTRPFLISAGILALTVAAGLAIGMSDVYAKGGTAKPPGGGGGGGGGVVLGAPLTVVPPAVNPVVPAPAFSDAIGNIVGFDATGFIESATVSSDNCPTSTRTNWGGVLVVNGQRIIIPCNTTLQMPAATYTWADLFDLEGGGTPLPTLALPGIGGGSKYPATEVSVTGNIVNGQFIAGLVSISQQSLNGGSGYITRIDYDGSGNSTGSLWVSSSPPPLLPGATETKITINDPTGKYTRGQSTDERFSVDSENPTIVSAGGYPVCIPRIAPPADDPRCPKKNRPRADGADGAGGCRTFASAGVVSPAGWTLSAPAGTYCTSFVMKAPPGTPLRPAVGATASTPAIPAITAAQIANANEPDARQQVPLIVGDFIKFSGTRLRDGTDTFSVHTIEANLGIFTQPYTLPVYVWIEETIIGADAIPVAGVVATPTEGQDRLVLVARTTDVLTPVDLYLIDIDPITGNLSHRWTTMESMTGTATGAGAVTGNITQPFLGGIMTQLTGPQPGRVRLRANKATPGILVSPTRYMRAVSRTLCGPANSNAITDGTRTFPYYGIDTQAPAVFVGSAPPPAAVNVTCLERAQVANGLYSGQYLAPVGEIIFPENVVAGDRLVPYNLWNLNFLASGEGPPAGPLGLSPGPLIPKPW
jgi:hypothetical protein